LLTLFLKTPLLTRRRTPTPPIFPSTTLFRSHVDACGAVRGARLAAQAQVERLGHLGGGPAARDERAVGHLLEHAGTPARRVLLVPGRKVGGAHEPARGGVVRATLTDPDAPVHGRREVAVVVREGEAARGG